MIDLSQLKQQRIQLGLTQSDLAKQAGVSQSLVAKIEARRIDPSYSSVLKIQNVLDRVSKGKEPIARDIMSTTLTFIKTDTPAKRIVSLFYNKGISQMPVVDGSGTVIGLVSESSILEHSEGDLQKFAAKDLLTAPPPLVDESTTKSALLSLLRQYRFILVTRKGKPVGAVTKVDIIRSLL